MASETKQSKSIIFGRCSCDQIVKYPFYWCEELIQEAKDKGYNIIDLKTTIFLF